MNIPQWIMVFLLAFSIINAIAKHDKIEIKKYNGVEMVLATLVEISLLVWGGYFDCWSR